LAARDGVGTPLADVHRQLAGHLDGVDERERAGVVGDVDQVRDGEPGPVGPRDGAETDQPRVGDGLGERVTIDPSCRRLDDAHLDALPFESLPGEDPAGCSTSVRTTTSPGCQSMAFAMALIPPVVLSVSAISSGSAPTNDATVSRVRSNASKAVS